MKSTYKAAICILILVLALGATAFAKSKTKKADDLFAQRGLAPLFGQAMLEYEQFYTKVANRPDYDTMVFLAKAYYFYGERYGANNKRKANSIFKLCTKWSQNALEAKPEDYLASYYQALCMQRAGDLQTQVKVDESMKVSKEKLEKLLSQHPDKPEVAATLGELYRISKEWPVGFRDLAESEKLLKKAHELAPQDLHIALEYAETLVALKKYDASKVLLTKIADMPEDEKWNVESEFAKKDAAKLYEKIRGLR